LCYFPSASMIKRTLAALVSLLCAHLSRAEVVINEIHYDPDVKTELVEFIEFYNTGPDAVDVSGWTISDAVEYVFPPNTSIAASGYLVVSQNPTHFNVKFRKTALGPWVGGLKNEGEQIVLRDVDGAVIDRVNYQLGFPWPTVGEAPGSSIELVNPAFDNDLGGNWRPCPPDETAPPTFKYFKGTHEPSEPMDAWRGIDFIENSEWLTGLMPIGYDGAFATRTTLTDWNDNYSTFYIRKTFQVDDPQSVASLQLAASYDDGFNAWINGRHVAGANMTGTEVPFDGLSEPPARESVSEQVFNLPPPGEYLVPGKNVLAIQVANVLKSGSSDFFIGAELIGIDNTSAATPGAPNRTATNNVPPAVRQVDHSPNQPLPGEAVTITAKVTDPEGVTSVQLLYQVVEPGNYIQLTDAAYATTWTAVGMSDTGAGGDEFAGDSVYTAVLPASLQTNRRLIRYRITATDAAGKTITAPYGDDPAPNFAYFCYAGVPAWSGAIQPGSPDQTRGYPQTFPSSVMQSLPTYHLISKKASVEDSTWRSRYGGDQYPWAGTLVYDGKVYDHVHYRARGGVWRYAMGKNMWKFDFNRGHDFKARDNWGREYNIAWTKLNLGACIQQGNFLHRGEQGMFESVGFRLFNLTGLEAPMTHFIHFRVIDEAAETGANQYTGDLWGLYLAVEQEDSRFLQAHDMPDSNLYKMEGGFGDLNNIGQLGPTDGSDLAQFLTDINGGQPESWWRENFDLPRYYNYRAIVEAIHHYDIDGNPGKNYFYYNNDVSSKWEVHPWDLDLTWANNMYGGGNEQFLSRVLPIENLNREYKNRVREIRDLLWNTDEAYKLIDEYAAMIYTRGAPSFVGVDRAMWDYNPIMISGFVDSNKAGQGRFYESAATEDFPGMVQIMKDYVVQRGALLDSQASDAGLPAKPTITNVSPAGNPANRLTFQSSVYSGSSGFAAMQWRLGEITPAGRPAFDRNNPRVYEIEPVWQSPEITTFSNRIVVPPGSVKVGHTYRARVKMKDSIGRWSNWSAPVQFVAGESDAITSLVNNLRVTEVMFNPPPGNDYEFVELFNRSADLSLDLSGVRFTAGIDYTFPTNTIMAPRSYFLVTRAPSLTPFRNYYGLTAGTQIYGPATGSLNNAGEEITLKTTTAGATIVSFTYGDNASWPVAANGAGHSMIPLFETLAQNDDDYSYPGNWRASAYMKGSPGKADPEPLAGPVINEVMANTQYSDPGAPGYDSNDWIEILNPTAAAVDWTGYYLSDDPLVLKKWAVPAGLLAVGAIASFDEVTGFHSPITVGFGLDQAGEQVFLSHFPSAAPARVVDAVEFKGLAVTSSWSRLPGGWRGAVPTRNGANGPALNSLVISEVMFHPATNVNTTIDNTLDEYVEIHNPTAGTVNLFAPGATWRLEGGVDFQFPAGTTLAAGQTLLLVNFTPTQTATSNAFRAKYNLPADTRIFGPYQGKLGNDSDRVAIERPEPPKAVGEPIVWIVVDEVTYGKRPLWPAAPNGTGPALQRVLLSGNGNDPANWRSDAPDPGRVVSTNPDRDNDGMPNDWEIANGLNPDSASDAAADADGDGISNLGEYQSGTDPRDAASGLKIASVEIKAGQFNARVAVASGKTYILEKCDDWNTRLWQTVREEQAAQTGTIDFTDPNGASAANRFYRIRLEP
jgi:hypothetical protein